MCGIIGIFGNNDPAGRARTALGKIVHRGSAAFELRDFSSGSLGANRLPIVDREFGQQPLSNEDGTVFAAQNGEIFNYRELKEELENKGHRFATDSDTEVLAHLYEEYGEAMMEKLDSEMFAFVIYDVSKNVVFAARDPLGVKPLYYAFDTAGQLYFSSEAKQLAVFEDIEEIFPFPPGNFFREGTFTPYFDLRVDNALEDEHAIIRSLEKAVVAAVRKRVRTDLPIGVLLSGGVDSSLVMEIATRFHPDVTAIILGYPGSSDYEFALRLCRDRGYKYHIVRPDIDYEQELDDIIYHLETYEPLIIRHSFASDICAREAHRLGLRVVLVGEGSDELFGGYNEFSSLPDTLINTGCELLTRSLHFGHLQRVDRMSMRHTVETRCPFFDREVVDLAFQIHGKLKVRKENHRIITKYILRKVAENFLPGYIAWRYKVPFSNGAGMNVGNNFKSEDGDIARIVCQKPEARVAQSLIDRYRVGTREEKYYLEKFRSFGLTKIVGSEQQLVVKDTLSTLYQARDARLIVAEFDRLALYFPVYFAAESGMFQLHQLDVDFIATGGDDRTYASLVNNSAHIGLADPMFAMFQNEEGVKGEIVGELVTRVPVVAVALNPAIRIDTVEDFVHYRVGTFQEFTTTQGVARYFLPAGTRLQSYDYQDTLKELVARTIDVAIVLPEQALDLAALGGRIVFDFQPLGERFLFSGFTIANTLEPKYDQAVRSFLATVRESMRYIMRNKAEAYEAFVRSFPELKDTRAVFERYFPIWSTTMTVEREDYNAAQRLWQKNYPGLLERYLPYFRTSSPADAALETMNAREYRRDFPFLEDRLRQRILDAQAGDGPLRFFAFWGAGDKAAMTDSDRQTLMRLREYFDGIRAALGRAVDVTFILADEHAKSNEYDEGTYGRYLAEVGALLREHGFVTVLLSDLWQRWGMTHEDIQELLRSKPPRWWSDVSLAEKLEKQSRHRPTHDPVRLAQQYFVLRSEEKGFLEKEFSESIFFSFSDGTMQSLYPTLPTLYLFARERGNGESPWFEDEGTEE